MERITKKRLKNWLETDSLYCLGFKLSIYNGYYHITTDLGSMVVCEKTAKATWDSWNLFKSGWRFAKTGIV